MQLSSMRPSPVELFVAGDEGPAVARLRTADHLHRVRRGVYARRSEWVALAPWDRYLARVHAYALVNPSAVFCLESAAALLGLPIFGEPRDIHLFDPARVSSTRSGDVAVHTSRDARACMDASWGHRVTAPLHVGLDLGRVLPPAYGLAVVDAVARQSADPDSVVAAFADAVATEQNARGRNRLRWLSTRIDARAESPGESVSRAVIEWLGLPAPELQHEFDHEGFRDRSDFYWPGKRVVGESDGWGKYAGTPEEMTEALRLEKLREDRLRRHESGFARWEWSDVMQHGRVDAKLRAAGLTPIGPANAAALATLRRNPRSLKPDPEPAARPAASGPPAPAD